MKYFYKYIIFIVVFFLSFISCAIDMGEAAHPKIESDEISLVILKPNFSGLWTINSDQSVIGAVMQIWFGENSAFAGGSLRRDLLFARADFAAYRPMLQNWLPVSGEDRNFIVNSADSPVFVGDIITNFVGDGFSFYITKTAESNQPLFPGKRYDLSLTYDKRPIALALVILSYRE